MFFILQGCNSQNACLRIANIADPGQTASDEAV